MKNVEISQDGTMLHIAIDTSKEFGLSRSGKTTIIASTEGNKKVEVDGMNVYVGLNCYKK